MFHLFVHRAVAATFLNRPVAAETQVHTDANLVTALGVSDSIMRHEEWLEFERLARAVVDPTVLDAIAGGRHGRVGFAVFTWSSGGHFEVLVPWTSIASIDDAERGRRRFAVRPRSPGPVGRVSAHAGRCRPSGPDLRTDISTSIEFAIDLALMAAYGSRRSIINVCANGRDNVGAGPLAARDRAVASDMTVNGLVLGAKDRLASYFRQHVQGGAGSFVIQVTKPVALSEAMVESSCAI